MKRVNGTVKQICYMRIIESKVIYIRLVSKPVEFVPHRPALNVCDKIF